MDLPEIAIPGLAQVIDSDFDAVVRMLLLARWVKAGRELDDWLESMRDHLHYEIDYRREAELTVRMAQAGAGVRAAARQLSRAGLAPRYCTDTVLAMEYIEGYSVTDPDVATLSLERRNALAQGMLDLFFYELYDWGCLQTDPNFGNYLLRLDDRRKKIARDELVLLDFGSVLDCSGGIPVSPAHIIDAGQQRGYAALVEGLIGLGCLHEDASEEGRKMFADFCLHLLEPLRRPRSCRRNTSIATASTAGPNRG